MITWAQALANYSLKRREIVKSVAQTGNWETRFQNKSFFETCWLQCWSPVFTLKEGMCHFWFGQMSSTSTLWSTFLSIATYCKTVVFAGKSASSTLFASNQSKLKEVFSVAPSLCPISPSNSQEPPIRTHPPVGEYKHFSCNQWFYQWSRWTPVSQQLSTLLSSCLVSKHQDCESLHFKCEASSGYLAMLTFYIKKNPVVSIQIYLIHVHLLHVAIMLCRYLILKTCLKGSNHLEPFTEFPC